REDVADRRDLDVGKRQVRPHVGAALTARADDADSHAIARADGGGRGLLRRGDERPRADETCGCAGKKRTACERHESESASPDGKHGQGVGPRAALSVDRAAAEVPRFPSEPLIARRIDTHGLASFIRGVVSPTIDPSTGVVKTEARAQARRRGTGRNWRNRSRRDWRAGAAAPDNRCATARPRSRLSREYFAIVSEVIRRPSVSHAEVARPIAYVPA